MSRADEHLLKATSSSAAKEGQIQLQSTWPEGKSSQAHLSRTVCGWQDMLHKLLLALGKTD